jgi:hypothetical protein
VAVIRVFGGAALGLSAIVLTGFGVVSTLPQPSHGDRIAVRALVVLQQHRGRGGVMQLAGVRLHVTCKRLPPYRQLIALDDGSRLVLSATHVRQVREPLRTRMLAVTENRPELVSAEADLAGSYALYAAQLTQRLAGGLPVLAGTTAVGGTPAYRLILGRGHPRVELLVDRQSLVPLAATYRSASLQGRTTLAQPAGRNAWRAC